MFTLPFAIRFICGPLIVATVAAVLFLFEPWSFSALAFDRSAAESWQLWRFVTGNVLHSNGIHLIMNLLAVLAIWALHGEHYPARRYFSLFLWLCLFCTVCIYLFTPQRTSYVGLSGVIHGFIVYGACLDIRDKIWLGWVLLVGVWLKIAQEQLFGASEATAELINATVATEAHLYGAIGGLLACVLVLAQSHSQTQTRSK